MGIHAHQHRVTLKDLVVGTDSNPGEILIGIDDFGFVDGSGNDVVYGPHRELVSENIEEKADDPVIGAMTTEDEHQHDYPDGLLGDREVEQQGVVFGGGIGRLKERHKVGSFYKIEVTEAEGKATHITWRYLAGKPKVPGEYVLRTSRTDLEEGEISLLHRTLTMIESSFRFLKSMLGIRPNFHQLDRRISAHVFISVLAYFFLAPILAKLNWGGEFTGTGESRESHEPWEIPYGWSGVVRTMASQSRVTTSFLCQDGQRMDIRTTVEPTLEQRALYQRLNLSPRPLGRVIVKEECAE